LRLSKTELAQVIVQYVRAKDEDRWEDLPSPRDPEVVAMVREKLRDDLVGWHEIAWKWLADNLEGFDRKKGATRSSESSKRPLGNTRARGRGGNADTGDLRSSEELLGILARIRGERDAARLAVIEARDEALQKSFESLSGYKFQMFGYWAAGWVKANRLLVDAGAGLQEKKNPFRLFVYLARAWIARERKTGGPVARPSAELIYSLGRLRKEYGRQAVLTALWEVYDDGGTKE
jgi:hypothetical protein